MRFNNQTKTNTMAIVKDTYLTPEESREKYGSMPYFFIGRKLGPPTKNASVDKKKQDKTQ